MHSRGRVFGTFFLKNLRLIRERFISVVSKYINGRVFEMDFRKIYSPA